MNVDRNKILKMVAILALLCAVVYTLTNAVQKNSITLQEYAEQNPEIAYRKSEEDAPTQTEDLEKETLNDMSNNSNSVENLQNESAEETIASISTLTGAILNGESVIDERITYENSFYYEPLSDNLRRYITGVSFPAIPENTEETIGISYDELCYLHILHYDFDGNLAEGELICNIAIAQDLVEIFYELYRNEYQLESVLLIDAFDGDDTVSMEANNTSCFNYRVVEGSTSLSKHALGLAIDINPLYNPYITYEKDGTENISPDTAAAYADRSASFPYKIDENDLCYKLFKERGFTWGGDWNSCKDYQHFQKTLK